MLLCSAPGQTFPSMRVDSGTQPRPGSFPCRFVFPAGPGSALTGLLGVICRAQLERHGVVWGLAAPWL